MSSILGWSLRLGSLLGVPVFVHWTFLLLVAWLMAGPLLAGGPNAVDASVRTGGLVLAVFGCVLLHEMGHALAARMYGIRTRDIVLLPIGGVARLERMPEKPVQELVVAVAGPLVNVVIAGVIIPGVLVTDGWGAFTAPPSGAMHQAHFLASLGLVNVMLVAFNAIPAFPMDGGRVLRAVLAMAMDRVAATRIAARTGQVVAVLLGLVAVTSGQLMLLVIALFVFMAAGAEAQAESVKSILRGVPVWRAMMTRFVTLRESQTLADAARELLAGSQQDFPVLADSAESADDARSLVGVLTRQNLLRALAAGNHETPVGAAMSRPCPSVRESDDLQEVLDGVQAVAPSGESGQAVADASAGGAGLRDCPVIAVVRTDPSHRPAVRIVGLVTPENVTELLMIRGAARRVGMPEARPGGR